MSRRLAHAPSVAIVQVVEVRQPSCRETASRTYEAVAPIVAGSASRHGNVFLEPRVGTSLYNRGRSSVLQVDVKAADGPFSISPVAMREGFEGLYYMYVYTSTPSRLVAFRDEDVPTDAVTGEILRDQILSFERPDGTHAFVLKKNKEAYLLSTADKCGFCKEPVGVMVEGRYDGTFYRTGNEKIHAECWNDYQVAKATMCIQCGKGITAVGGMFCGGYFDIEGKGAVHSECHDDFMLSTADKCGFCKEPVGVVVDGKYDGRFYRTDDGKIHSECYDDYQVARAPTCLHCSKAITAIGGTFSGSYYPVDGGKVHEECNDAFRG